MQQSVNQRGKAIAIFLLITFSLSSIYYFLMIHTGKIGAGGGMYVIGLMWSPALSAFITCKILRRKIADLGWSWNKQGYLLWCYLIPLANNMLIAI